MYFSYLDYLLHNISFSIHLHIFVLCSSFSPFTTSTDVEDIRHLCPQDDYFENIT